MAKLKFYGGRDPERRKAAERGDLLIIHPRGFERANTDEQPKEYRKTMTTYAIQIHVPFEVETLEGPHTGNAGDFLAIGPAGEMYPIKEDIFYATYEEVKDAGK